MYPVISWQVVSCLRAAIALMLCIQVLQGANCRHASSFADRARLKGSFRDTAGGTMVDRLMGAYEVGTLQAFLLAYKE
jgi:glutamate mutase epsilon subunit